MISLNNFQFIFCQTESRFSCAKMLLKVTLLIFLSSEINCYSYYPSRRVQNGDKLDPKVIPKFFVALLREIDHVYHKKFEFHCAGTLISPKNVLTAGYCIR